MTYTKEQAKEKLVRLIEKFKRDLESGKLKHFNEEQTKKDYIEPFFECLNWDTRESDEVVVEEKVSKGRVDYGFRIDGIPKFYVEAKSFKEDLDSTVFAEQAINYARLKSVTWAILTNFEGLKVFNAEWESKNPLHTIYIDLKWNDFLAKFDKIWLLSKDSFLENELDREAEEYGKKIKKTAITPVMKQIFNDLMIWRDKLTKSISNYASNSKIAKTNEELDEDVQRIIDRLIFIRVCEDKEIEKITLQSKVREWLHSHKKPLIDVLNEIFRDFDEGYNSKLFAKHPSQDLKIDDTALIDVINELYESSDKVFKYDFSAIEVDVLGNIYEEYLGYILKKGKQKIGITESHLHRKEMGIYYTPTFVVDYIIKNTIDEMLKQMKPNEIDDIKVLDMACGSGSFLLKAFDKLNDYHKSKNELDFLRKIKILTNNIYGVDLDPKAIEITQLNLLLKTVEKRRLLPKLQDNLKVGNSLINDRNVSNRPFDWNLEFTEIIKNGGFDVIIGNPPYIRSQSLNKEDKTTFELEYKSAKNQYDIYILFIEKAIQLLKYGGFLGFIVPNKFLVSDYGLEIRKLILDNCEIKQIIDISNLEVFRGVGTYPIILILQKRKHPDPNNKIKILNNVKSQNYLFDPRKSFDLTIQKSYVENEKKLFLTTSSTNQDILDKINQDTINLGKIATISRGIIPDKQEEYVISSNEYDKLNREQKILCKKALRARNVNRFAHGWNGEYFYYHNKFSIKRSSVFEEPKIIMPRTVLVLKASYDDDGYTLVDRLYYIRPTDKKFHNKYLLALLNSKLISFYYRTMFGATHLQGGYLDLKGIDLEKIPIKVISAQKQNEIIKHVDNILELKKELVNVNLNSDKGKKLQEEINRIDTRIDKNVYELYGLRNEEIKIIESN